MVASPPRVIMSSSPSWEEEDDQEDMTTTALVTITDEQVRPSSTSSPRRGGAGVSLSQEGQEEEDDPFQHIDQIMDLEHLSADQVRDHPAFEHLSREERALVAANLHTFSQEELAQVKLSYLATHMTALAQSATYNLVELGKIIAMGNLTGLFKLTGCRDMYEWARTALHIEPRLLSLAMEKYNAWLYIREFGFEVEVLTSATSTHLQLIGDLARDIHRQQEEIRRRKIDERRSPPSPTTAVQEEQEEDGEDTAQASSDLLVEVASEYKAIATAEIARILELDPKTLLEEQALATGAILRPHLSLTVSYNPRTGNLECIDPRTGRSIGVIGYLSESHLRGLAKGQVNLSFHLHLADATHAALIKPTLSTKELGLAILEHCPPEFQEIEGEMLSDTTREEEEEEDLLLDEGA